MKKRGSRHYLSTRRGVQALRGELRKWRNNHATFVTAAVGNKALEAAVPISRDIALLSSAALDAIHSIETGRPLPSDVLRSTQQLLARQDAWKRASTSVVAVALAEEQPPANLLIAVVPSIKRLIDAAPR